MQWKETFSLQGIRTEFRDLTPDDGLRILARFIARRVLEDRLAKSPRTNQTIVRAVSLAGGNNEHVN